MNEDRFAHRLRHLENVRQRTQKHIDKQQARADERFEKARERIERMTNKRSLSQDRIIEAALALLKEHGLAGLSLRDIALQLDIKAPALYWHFKNKEELIDYIAEAILRKEFSTFVPRQDSID